MAFRVILIENEVTIKVRLNNLIVTKEGNDTWVPLDDISMIVLDNLSSTITARLMCQLSEHGIGLILCNQEHLPTGFYGAYDNHSRASKVIGYQINKDREFYGTLWKEIVENKILNQSKAYLRISEDGTGAQKIADFAMGISLGDKGNREAHAAKIYFNQLMGSTFSRGNDDLLLNSGLDYGYAVLRAYIARACVGYGLNTQLGIHHKSEYNRFNLVDDLMEPLRPMIDVTAYRILDGEPYFTAEHRRELVNVLNMKFGYRNKQMYVGNMIENYVEQYASLIMGRCENIIFPDINEFVIGENDGL